MILEMLNQICTVDFAKACAIFMMPELNRARNAFQRSIGSGAQQVVESLARLGDLLLNQEASG